MENTNKSMFYKVKYYLMSEGYQITDIFHETVSFDKPLTPCEAMNQTIEELKSVKEDITIIENKHTFCSDVAFFINISYKTKYGEIIIKMDFRKQEMSTVTVTSIFEDILTIEEEIDAYDEY